MTDNQVGPSGVRQTAWFERPGTWWTVGFVGCVCVAAGYAFLIYHHGWEFGRTDLEIYRTGTKIALDGGSPYGDEIRPLGPFLYPPFAVFTFAAATFVPLKVAQSVWVVGNLAAFALTIGIIASNLRLPSPLRRPVTVSLIAGGFALAPVWLTVVYGQVNIVLLMLIAADVLVDRPRWPRGLLVGLAIAIKLTPAVFVVWFFLTGRRREALVATGTFVVSMLAGLAFMHDVAVDYWSEIATQLPVRLTLDHVLNQSAYALLLRFEAPSPRTLALGVALVVAVVGLWRARAAHRAGDDLAALAICGATSVLLAPVSWVHHGVWVAVGAVCLVDRGLRGGDARPVWAGAALTVAAVTYFPRAGDWWIREVGWMLPAALVREWFFFVGVGLVCLLPYGVPRGAERRLGLTGREVPALAELDV